MLSWLNRIYTAITQRSEFSRMQNVQRHWPDIVQRSLESYEIKKRNYLLLETQDQSIESNLIEDVTDTPETTEQRSTGTITQIQSIQWLTLRLLLSVEEFQYQTFSRFEVKYFPNKSIFATSGMIIVELL